MGSVLVSVGPPRVQSQSGSGFGVPRDLRGRWVLVEEADEYEVVLRLPDGTRIKVRAEVDCSYWDGNVCTDEDWDVYLDYEVEG